MCIDISECSPGARKGGTRALLEMLALHPGVRVANQEVHFFDNETNYARGYSWYLSQLPGLEPGQISLEKSPSYLVTPGVATRVRAMDSRVKLLVIVREPVTRLQKEGGRDIIEELIVGCCPISRRSRTTGKRRGWR